MARQTITAMYDDYNDASAAVDQLEAGGIQGADISLISSNEGDRHSARMSRDPSHDNAKEGAKDGTGTGATVGTVVGGAAGLLTGLGLIAIPGVGPVVAAGWLVATLTGAGIGAAAGGLAGALTGAGIGEADAQAYDEGVRRGGTLVTVRADDTQAPRVMDILERHGAIDLAERADEWRTGGWAPPAGEGIAPTGTGTSGAVDSRRRVRSYPNSGADI